ncbi:MAG TPA: response regulator [Terracidiphilus sp.]|nr:response regulator [Terracidiphilus sp.]
MSHRILVVEDNLLNLELLCDWLDTEGYTAEAAVNLREAFAAFVRQPPDAVLLDVQLGTEDGLSLAMWIRSDTQFRSLPVIAVTAHAMLTDQQRVLQAGCNACVSKPIDFQLLSKHLRAYLSGHSLSL